MGVPPLDKPLVYDGESGGVGGILEADDKLSQLVAGLLLGFTPDTAKVVKPRY